MFLAGDIGGTKTHLTLFEVKGETVHLIREKKFPSKDYENLETIALEFISDDNHSIKRACFGIAGPIKNEKCIATNLPWVIDAAELRKILKIESISLINDLEANAYGLKTLPKNDFYVLNQGDQSSKGNKALISAGTGLGEAGLYFDGKDHHPFACEGGHCEFAPRNDLEIELLNFLRKKYEHVSYERVLSGPALYNLYSFLTETGKEKADITYEDEKQAPIVISDKGLKKESAACVRTLELFSSIYGAAAGNMALKFMAFGGVYLGGGIAPKILDVIKNGSFMKAYLSKGRFQEFVSQIPVRVVLNEKTALLGAAFYAKNGV